MKYFRSMLLALVATPLFATTYNVSTTQELTDALANPNLANGDEIVLAAGTYTVSQTIPMLKGITIRGAGSRENTIIRPSFSNTNIVFIAHSDAVLKNVTLSGLVNNNAYNQRSYMSAAYIADAGGTITNCVIRDNTIMGTYCGHAAARIQGGRMTGCLITGNTGGHAQCSSVYIGTSATQFAAGYGRVDHCVISNNVTTSGKSSYGAVSLNTGYLDNCLIVKNSCFQGDTAGVRISNYGVMSNCTVADNEGCTVSGGGVFWANQPYARIVNCIFYGNTGTKCDWAKTNNTKDSDLPKSFKNCIFEESDVGGTDCLVGNPMFGDAANGDYRIGTSSVAADSGLASWKAGTKNEISCSVADVDFAGNPRTIGNAVDIDCYESDPSAVVISCDFAANKATCSLGQSIALTSIVNGTSGSEAYLWYLINDSTHATSTYATANVDFTPSAAGVYSVELTVTEGNSSRTVIKPAYLTVNDFRCSFVAGKTEGLSGSSFVFTSTVVGAVGEISCSWSFTNETTGVVQASTLANPSFTADAPGQITVVLSVTDGVSDASSCVANYLTVQTGICYVDPDSTSAVFPYSTWNTAASNIVDAVAAVGAGGEVILASKAISVSDKITLDKGVAVRGSGAREDTVIGQTVQSKSVFAVAHADAV